METVNVSREQKHKVIAGCFDVLKSARESCDGITPEVDTAIADLYKTICYGAKGTPEGKENSQYALTAVGTLLAFLQNVPEDSSLRCFQIFSVLRMATLHYSRGTSREIVRYDGFQRLIDCLAVTRPRDYGLAFQIMLNMADSDAHLVEPFCLGAAFPQNPHAPPVDNFHNAKTVVDHVVAGMNAGREHNFPSCFCSSYRMFHALFMLTVKEKKNALVRLFLDAQGPQAIIQSGNYFFEDEVKRGRTSYGTAPASLGTSLDAFQLAFDGLCSMSLFPDSHDTLIDAGAVELVMQMIRYRPDHCHTHATAGFLLYVLALGNHNLENRKAAKPRNADKAVMQIAECGGLELLSRAMTKYPKEDARKYWAALLELLNKGQFQVKHKEDPRDLEALLNEIEGPVLEKKNKKKKKKSGKAADEEAKSGKPKDEVSLAKKENLAAGKSSSASPTHKIQKHLDGKSCKAEKNRCSQSASSAPYSEEGCSSAPLTPQKSTTRITTPRVNTDQKIASTLKSAFQLPIPGKNSFSKSKGFAEPASAKPKAATPPPHPVSEAPSQGTLSPKTPDDLCVLEPKVAGATTAPSTVLDVKVSAPKAGVHSPPTKKASQAASFTAKATTPLTPSVSEAPNNNPLFPKTPDNLSAPEPKDTDTSTAPSIVEDVKVSAPKAKIHSLPSSKKVSPATSPTADEAPPLAPPASDTPSRGTLPPKIPEIHSAPQPNNADASTASSTVVDVKVSAPKAKTHSLPPSKKASPATSSSAKAASLSKPSTKAETGRLSSLPPKLTLTKAAPSPPITIKAPPPGVVDKTRRDTISGWDTVGDISIISDSSEEVDLRDIMIPSKPRSPPPEVRRSNSTQIDDDWGAIPPCPTREPPVRQVATIIPLCLVKPPPPGAFNSQLNASSKHPPDMNVKAPPPSRRNGVTQTHSTVVPEASADSHPGSPLAMEKKKPKEMNTAQVTAKQLALQGGIIATTVTVTTKAPPVGPTKPPPLGVSLGPPSLPLPQVPQIPSASPSPHSFVEPQTLQTQALQTQAPQTLHEPHMPFTAPYLVHPEQLVDVDPQTHQQFVCKVCALLVRNPVVPACAHVVCSNCLRGTECPTCHKPVSQRVMLDKSAGGALAFLFRIYSSIKVRCFFSVPAPCAHLIIQTARKVGHSCTWRGSIFDYDTHVNDCVAHMQTRQQFHPPTRNSTSSSSVSKGPPPSRHPALGSTSASFPEPPLSTAEPHRAPLSTAASTPPVAPPVAPTLTPAAPRQEGRASHTGSQSSTLPHAERGAAQKNSSCAVDCHNSYFGEMEVQASWSAFDGGLQVNTGDVVMVSNSDSSGHWAYATVGAQGGWLPRQLLKAVSFVVKLPHPSDGAEGRLALKAGEVVLIYHRGPNGWTYGARVSEPELKGWFPDACVVSACE